MARKMRVLMIDDLDGEAADDVAAVRFGIDGIEYEIDLNAEHAAELRESLARFVAAGRRLGKGKGAGRPARTGPDPADVRAWARDAGQDVPERGRIPAAVVDAYRAAHAA